MRARQAGDAAAAAVLAAPRPFAGRDQRDRQQRAERHPHAGPDQALLDRIAHQEEAAEREREAADPDHPLGAEALLEAHRGRRRRRADAAAAARGGRRGCGAAARAAAEAARRRLRLRGGGSRIGSRLVRAGAVGCGRSAGRVGAAPAAGDPPRRALEQRPIAARERAAGRACRSPSPRRRWRRSEWRAATRTSRTIRLSTNSPPQRPVRPGRMLGQWRRPARKLDQRFSRPPKRRPAAGRSCATSRRKRNSAAGRPPVAVDISPVGSTSAALSTSRRKFCLCRWRPEIASTVRCNLGQREFLRHQLEHHRPVFELGAQPRDRGRQDAAMIEAHRLAERRQLAARERRFAAVAPRLLDQAGLVEQLVAVEHLLLVPGRAADAEAQPQPLAPAERAAGLRPLRARRPIRRAAAGSWRRESSGAARASPPTERSGTTARSRRRPRAAAPTFSGRRVSAR